MTNDAITEDKQKYFDGSKIFVGLAKKGDIEGLIEHVYSQSDPYIQYVPSRSKLAKNALSFFVINNHTEAFEKFFTSPFIEDIEKSDVFLIANQIISQGSKDFFQIIQKYYIKNCTDIELLDMLFDACSNTSVNIIKDIMQQFNKTNRTFTQAEKIQCCVSALSLNLNNDKTNTQKLATFNFLESIFPDLLYHQQDDVLVRTVVQARNDDALSYLMYEKKLRITKHLNMLALGNQNFSKFVEKRKLYDSMNQKMLNNKNKQNDTQTKSKKPKI